MRTPSLLQTLFTASVAERFTTLFRTVCRKTLRMSSTLSRPPPCDQDAHELSSPTFVNDPLNTRTSPEWGRQEHDSIRYPNSLIPEYKNCFSLQEAKQKIQIYTIQQIEDPAHNAVVVFRTPRQFTKCLHPSLGRNHRSDPRNSKCSARETRTQHQHSAHDVADGKVFQLLSVMNDRHITPE